MICSEDSTASGMNFGGGVKTNSLFLLSCNVFHDKIIHREKSLHTHFRPEQRPIIWPSNHLKNPLI